jgi:trimeric autotransporter adhesin
MRRSYRRGMTSRGAVVSRRSLVAAAVAIALVPAAGAGPGAPQPWVPNDGVDALAVAGDSLFLGGDFERLGPRTGHFVISSLERNAPRLLRGHVSGPVYAMVDDGRGGWFIGGDFPTVGGVACPYLAHIRADGDLDRRWCPAPNAGVRALARGRPWTAAETEIA